MTEDGIFQWLLYVIVALVGAFFTIWNRAIGNRMALIEDTQQEFAKTLGEFSRCLHNLETTIERRFVTHERYEREIDEKHSAEMRAELALLGKELQSVSREILERVHAIDIAVQKLQQN